MRNLVENSVFAAMVIIGTTLSMITYSILVNMSVIMVYQDARQAELLPKQIYSEGRTHRIKSLLSQFYCLLF